MSSAKLLSMIVVYGLSLLLVGVMVNSFLKNHESLELESQVEAFNRAVYLFRASGGDLSDALTPEQVIAKLRAVEEDPFALTVQSILTVGLRPVYQTPSEARTQAERAFWDVERQIFELTNSGPRGIKVFTETDTGNSIRTPAAASSVKKVQRVESLAERRAREIEAAYRHDFRP